MTNEYEILVSREEIQKRIDILGQEIASALDDDAIVIGLLPVSYTHLDVYKRQGVDWCNCNFGCYFGAYDW